MATWTVPAWRTTDYSYGMMNVRRAAKASGYTVKLSERTPADPFLPLGDGSFVEVREIDVTVAEVSAELGDLGLCVLVGMVAGRGEEIIEIPWMSDGPRPAYRIGARVDAGLDRCDVTGRKTPGRWSYLAYSTALDRVVHLCRQEAGALALGRIRSLVERMNGFADLHVDLPGRERAYSTFEMFALGATVVRLDGAWTNAKVAQGAGTISSVARARELFDRGGMVSDADRETARRVLERLRLCTGRFEQDACALLEAAYAPATHLGLLAAACASQLGDLREDRRVLARGGHLGHVGDRQVMSLQLDRSIPLGDTGWGVRYLHCFRAPGGERVVWRTQSRHDLTVGGWYLVKATVDRHDEYREEPQTAISRAKILDIPDA